MTTSRRLAWLLLILGVSLFLGILFRDLILTNFVRPMAVVLMLVWRLILSVHQALYWGLLILAFSCVALYRLVKAAVAAEENPPEPSETTLRSIGYWQASLLATGVDNWASLALKRELARILVAIYGSQQPDARLYDLREALRSKRIPLPPKIHAFLFPGESERTERPWRRRLRHLVEAPRRWARQWTGRDKAEYYQTVEETLAYMETLMEIRHDKANFDAADH